MRVLFGLLPLLYFLSSCAMEQKKGVLLNVEPGTPMDESDLHQHCDLGDEAACALAAEGKVPEPTPRIPILQGVAPPDRAVFSALIPKGHEVHWFLYERELSKLTKLFTVKPVTRGSSPWALQRLDVQGLIPNRSYELLAGDPEGHLLELRRFRPFDTDEKELRIALLGGLRSAPHTERARLFSVALSKQPQLLVLAGSSLALPTTAPGTAGKNVSDSYFERHAEARASLEIALARDLTPVTAIWNDDEFGHADGDQSFSFRDRSRESLELFFPHWSDETTIVNGPGISLAMAFRSQTLALVDDLSFRKPPTAGEPICKKKKGKEVCQEGKSVAAPPGTRYAPLLRNWIESRAKKAESPLWILAGGARLLPFRPDWYDDPIFAAPGLSRPPTAPWAALAISSGASAPRIEALSGDPQKTK